MYPYPMFGCVFVATGYGDECPNQALRRTSLLRTTFLTVAGAAGAATSGWRCWQVARGHFRNTCPSASDTSTINEFLHLGQGI